LLASVACASSSWARARAALLPLPGGLEPETETAAPHRACWYAAYKQRGLRVKLAIDDDGQVGGMIQYLPIEHAPALGRDLYFVLCIWVHGHAQGRGNFQGHGMGTALLEAAEADVRALGAKGMAAWGLALPFWMRASWFKKHGYRKVDRNGIASLSGSPSPRTPKRRAGSKRRTNGRSWCPAKSWSPPA